MSEVTGVSITVNGREVVADEGQLLIEACEKSGIYIPRFCYHPRMESVGMCRQCIVEVDTGRGPGLQPSCMLTVSDGMVVDTESDMTKKAQDGVLEFLLINHPLDCPVCDKGGECPLQDETMAYGPGESRLVEEKRHFEKPIPISGLVDLDRERCILCDRCTRFAKDVAGDPFIHFMERANQTQINTFPDHPFASYFSGNTIQICPVGALTAPTYRFKARPWDLASTESTCTSCSVGCRITIDSSRNEVLRYRGVDIDPVNWGWLCDKGRFDFESVNSENRLLKPMLRSGDNLADSTWAEAMRFTVQAIKDGIDRSGPGGLAVVGGARLTNEDAYAWTKLVKGVLGSDNVDAQLGDGLPADAVLGLPRATIDDACAKQTTVISIGPDLKEEVPVLFLRMRHAVKKDGVKLIEIVPAGGPTDYLAHATVTYRPGELAATVKAVLSGDTSAEGALGVAAEALAGVDDPVVLLGRANLAESGELVAAAAEQLLAARPGARFLSTLRRANVHGALDMGMSPGLLPGRVTLDGARQAFYEVWPTLPESVGLDTTGILEASAGGKIDTLILLGADPLNDFPDRDLATRALAGARQVIALDTFLTTSGRQADVVLPVAGFAECAGTTTNLEGRVSVLHPQVTAPGTTRPDWMVAADLALRLGADLGFESVDDVWAEIEQVSAVHHGITLQILASKQFSDGILAPREQTVTIGSPATAAEDTAELKAEDAEPTSDAVEENKSEAAEAPAEAAATVDADGEAEAEDSDEGADEASKKYVTLKSRNVETPAVDAYGLRLVVNRRLYDLGTLVQESPHLAPLAADTELRLHPHDFSRIGVGEGETVKLSSARVDSLEVVCRSDETIPKGNAHVFFNHPGIRAADLIDATALVNDIRIQQ